MGRPNRVCGRGAGARWLVRQRVTRCIGAQAPGGTPSVSVLSEILPSALPERRRTPPVLPNTTQEREASSMASGVDSISALPDEILLLILARLRCVRTAVQTGLLSRPLDRPRRSHLPRPREARHDHSCARPLRYFVSVGVHTEHPASNGTHRQTCQLVAARRRTSLPEGASLHLSNEHGRVGRHQAALF